MTKAIKYSNQMDDGAISAAIKSIGNRAGRINKDIQCIGLSILARIEENGERVAALNALFLALGQGLRRASFMAWALQFGKVKLNEEQQTKKDRPFLYDKFATTDLAGATQLEWFKAKDESAELAKIMDVGSEIARLIARLTKGENNNPAAVAALQELGKKYPAMDKDGNIKDKSPKSRV